MSPVTEAIPVEIPSATTPQRPRMAIWQVVVLAGLVGLLYFPVITKLIRDWWVDPNFSHGFFVPLFSAYLVWIQREKLARIPVKPSWAGLVIIALALLILVVGILAVDLFIPRFSFVLLLAGVVLFFRGWAYFRSVFFAWAFLFLMIPFPLLVLNQVTFPLQLLASRLASTILPLLNVPVLRQGNIIQLPSMPLEVAEACSGIRSLMSLTTLAIIYGFFLDSNPWRRTWLAFAAVPIAVVANAMRIVGTGLAVQYWDPDRALGFFHEFSGWVIFMVSLFLLFAVHGATRFLGSRFRTSHP